MTEDKRITLPGREEMLRRLRSVISGPHTEQLYAVLAREAGARKTAAGIVTMLKLAIYDYASGIPAVQMTMDIAIPDYVSVLTEDDQGVRDEALGILQGLD